MFLRWEAISLFLLFLHAVPSQKCYAQDLPQSSYQTFTQKEESFNLPAPRLSGEARLRYQSLSRDDFLDSAEALTLRFKGRVEFDLFEKTTALVELDGNVALINNFNDGSNGRLDLPFIPDPNGFDLNRLQITTEVVPQTRVTLGRQRIELDDWRFIGAFPFRQNDQTIDAVRVETKILGKGILDLGYFNKVHRPLGSDNLRGVFEGNSFFANYNIGTPFGRFSAFHYALGLESGPEGVFRQDESTQTTGIRLLGRRDGDKLSLSWEGSYARQADRLGNPEDYNSDYVLAELTLKPRNLIFKGRAEVLGSDNGASLQTPLASLHQFQGFADQFLTTPPDGLRDYSLFVGYDVGKIGPFERVRAFSRYHWFESDVNKRAYGEELNLSLSGRLNNMRLSLQYANYQTRGFSADNQALFLSTDFSF